MNLEKANNTISIKDKSKKLPENPGVYMMKNTTDEIIYIGKAKNLKNRVSSYFMSDTNHTEKVKKMIENISRFDYIVTDSEFEALVLECSLIKKYQPKYNILLKDDKGYSYIKITHGFWPRVLYTKQKLNDDAMYIGPYTNSLSTKKAVEEIIRIFKIPVCSRNFSRVYKRPCLNYYIGRCFAPCIRAISHEKYLSTIEEAVSLIKNGSAEAIKNLDEKMNKASQSLNFEYAAQLRDKIKAIKDVKNRQKVVSYKVEEQDVIAVATDETKASFEVFRFSSGDLYENQNFIVDLEKSILNTRTEFIKQYYSLKDNIPKNITLDGDIENLELIKKFLSQKSGKNISISIPQKGDGARLVKMCKNNAYESLLRSKENKNRYEDTLEELKNIFSIKNTPRYIEAYDISNLQGCDNVGGMVVFENGRPSRTAYRKFKICTVKGQDDYNSMREVIERRINRYLESGQNCDSGFGKLPDLILVDGGTNHVKAAKEVLRSKNIDVPVFGMVKDSKHRTRAITTEREEIEIKKKSRIFSLITSIQDEVHRYAIGYHKKLREKKIKSSELLKIPNVGERRAKLLLKAFGSIERISHATEKELALISGITKSTACSVFQYFNGPSDSRNTI